MRAFILSLILSSALAGCSMFGGSDNTKKTSSNTVAALYQKAKTQLDNKNYGEAIIALDSLVAQYPFTQEAIQAQLDLIFAHNERESTIETINTAKTFINRHPQHAKVDYAYYMIGIARFNQGKSAFERFLSVDLSKRDLANVKNAFNDFSKLLHEFPNSTYAADARQRMIYLRNIMGRAEINVANYYFQREAYLAAANRGKYVVENFSETPAAADGLAVMTQAYTLLQMQELANDTLAILRKNYPTHASLNKDGSFKLQLTQDQVKPSFLNKISLGLFKNPQAPKFDTRDKTEF